MCVWVSTWHSSFSLSFLHYALPTCDNSCKWALSKLNMDLKVTYCVYMNITTWGGVIVAYSEGPNNTSILSWITARGTQPTGTGIGTAFLLEEMSDSSSFAQWWCNDINTCGEPLEPPSKSQGSILNTNLVAVCPIYNAPRVQQLQTDIPNYNVRDSENTCT